MANHLSGDAWAFGTPYRPRRHGRRASLIAMLAAFTLVVGAAAAFAVDGIVADGDGLAPVSSSALAFGNVCPDSGSTKDVLLAIRQQNTNANQSFANGESVAVTRGTISTGSAGTLSAAASVGTINLPLDWNNPRETNKMSDSVTSSVTLSVPSSAAAGAQTRTINYIGTSATESRNSDLTVTWTVLSSSHASCAPADSTPPTITPNVVGTLGNGGWYTSDVSVSWTVQDPESNITSTNGCDPTTIDTDTTGTTLTCQATSAGGTNSASVTIKRDAAAPVITDEGFDSGTSGSNGWYTSAVLNVFAASDATSGLADCSANFTKSSGAAEGSAVMIGSGPCSDNAGNTNAGIESSAYKIDLGDPGVTCDGTPTFTKGQLNAQVSATVTDAISGPAASPVYANADTSSVGSRSANVTGYDNAGRSTTVGCSYNVVYDFNGFFRPIDNGGVFNSLKAGQAVPVKFSLGGNQGLNIFEAGFPKSKQVACETSAGIDFLEETVTAGNSSLSYDSAADQYNYVWKTEKSWAGTCRELVVKLDDGTTHTALFKLLK